jgi:hypothetical protein
MKKLVLLLMFLAITATAFAEIKWVNGYYTKGGQYRSGHYKDTSGDGNPYNNAEYLGY